MVTQLLRAAVFDVFSVAKTAHFFDAKEGHRLTILSKELGDYPEPFLLYLTDVKAEKFLRDALELAKLLGTNTSVMSEAWRLTQSENEFFHAFLASMKTFSTYRDQKTQLGAVLNLFHGAGRKYTQVLARELQTLLLLARGEDSPVIQMAAEVPIDLSTLPGVPSVVVRRSLLGGARLFHDGKLNDQSWRARLTNLLSNVLSV